MVVRFTKGFLKELKKYQSKQTAKLTVKKLSQTNAHDGKHVSVIADLQIRELKDNSFRFYFIQKKEKIEILTPKELKDKILLFIQISKKNNQQRVINKLKEDLLNKGFKL